MREFLAEIFPIGSRGPAGFPVADAISNACSLSVSGIVQELDRSQKIWESRKGGRHGDRALMRSAYDSLSAGETNVSR